MNHHLQKALNKYAKPSNPDQGSRKSFAVQNAIFVSYYIYLSPAGRKTPPGYPTLLARWHSDLNSDPGTGSEAAAALGSSPMCLADCPQSCCLIESCSITQSFQGCSTPDIIGLFDS